MYDMAEEECSQAAVAKDFKTFAVAEGLTIMTERNALLRLLQPILIPGRL